MAIVERRDKQGIVYYVANEWNGRQKSERVGRNRREAERRDQAMKKEIAAGTYQPPGERKGALTVGDIAALYHAKRTVKSKDNELSYSRNHIESHEWLWKKRADEVRPADCDRLIAELRSIKKDDGSRRLSDKTIMDVLQLLKRIFASALRAELVDRQPVVLEHGTWDHTPKQREPYTAAEALVLISHHKVPWPTRVLIALWILAGLRQGEGCGLKWKRLDLAARPLAALTIAEQWRGEALKTKRPRIVPVHPMLLAILKDWAETGFEAYTGQSPTPEDYIVPQLDGFGVWNCFGAHTSYRRFVEACEATGIRHRTLHSCRHTFVTLCRRGGARPDVLERVSHNASGKMIDRYTHFDWEPLCEAVMCLQLERPPEAPSLAGNVGVIELPELPGDEGISRENSDWRNVSPSSIAAPQTPAPHQVSRIGDRSQNVQAGAHGNGGEQRVSRGRGRLDHELLRNIESRRQRLLILASLDPTAARPGLAVCRGYEAVVGGNEQATLAALQEAAEALGLTGARRG